MKKFIIVSAVVCMFLEGVSAMNFEDTGWSRVVGTPDPGALEPDPEAEDGSDLRANVCRLYQAIRRLMSAEDVILSFLDQELRGTEAEDSKRKINLYRLLKIALTKKTPTNADGIPIPIKVEKLDKLDSVAVNNAMTPARIALMSHELRRRGQKITALTAAVPTADGDVQTNLTGVDIDKRVASTISFRDEMDRLRELLAVSGGKIGEQDREIAHLNRELGVLQRRIEGQQEEKGWLAEQIGDLEKELEEATRLPKRVNMTVKEYNECLEYKKRLDHLLTRAHTGRDYRLVGFQVNDRISDAIYTDRMKYTIAAIANNDFCNYSEGDISWNNCWRPAHKIISCCLARIDYIGTTITKSAMPEYLFNIETEIRELRALLPVKKITRKGGKNSGYLGKETRVIVGRSLDKALETIIAFRNYINGGYKNFNLPDDNIFEIAEDDNVCEAYGLGDMASFVKDKFAVVKKKDGKRVCGINDSEDARFLSQQPLSPSSSFSSSSSSSGDGGQ